MESQLRDLFKSIQFKTKLGYGRARYLIQAPSQSPASPLLQELYHNSARYASLLIGTNDLLYHKGLERFSWRYIQIIETLKDQGVIPLAQTLPPQEGQAATHSKNIATFNRLIGGDCPSRTHTITRFIYPVIKIKSQRLKS